MKTVLTVEDAAAWWKAVGAALDELGIPDEGAERVSFIVGFIYGNIRAHHGREAARSVIDTAVDAAEASAAAREVAPS